MSRAAGADLRLAVVGNPENRRVGLLARAAERLGMRPPRVVPWLDVLNGAARFEPGELVRIDSPGENAEVARLLQGSAEPIDMYRVEGTKRWYAGFTAALEKLHAHIAECDARALESARDTAVAFDKARTHALLKSAGVRVPDALPPVEDFAGVRAGMAERGWHLSFAKIRHGSSASGVVRLAVQAHGPMSATTSAELSRQPGGYELYNSLRVRCYTKPHQVVSLIDILGRDGLHVEELIGTPWPDGRNRDMRLVTVAGRVTHAVGRDSAHPMTNLHLGGRRRDIAEYRERFGGERWQAAVALAEQAAALFPDSHCLGIDLLDDDRQSYVGEVNAYGDLLPDLTGLPGTLGEGVDTYTAQLRSLAALYG